MEIKIKHILEPKLKRFAVFKDDEKEGHFQLQQVLLIGVDEHNCVYHFTADGDLGTTISEDAENFVEIYYGKLSDFKKPISYAQEF